MGTKLLRTKLFIPPARSGLVYRTRMIEELNASQQHRLTLLSAPAGFGKTTLLSEWIASSDLKTRVAWVSHDKGDNDPDLFWSYIVAAFQTIDPNLGSEILEALLSPQPPPIEPMINELINEITRFVDPVTLILDDFHVITEPSIHENVARLLDNLPVQLHLIISSRADPPWSLAQLRAHGELIELRAADLRFTSDEVVAFLNDAMELGLSAESIAALDARTEGWIAGLQLAAISMQGRDADAFIQAFSGSHRFILDYLVEEVLDRQSADIREFLLKTSILERMMASLCDRVANCTDSQDILSYLESANLFVLPLDDDRCWYRYHHLFSELLRNQLALNLPDQSSELHQRASVWFEEQGFTEETISHAFAARDYERAARLVEKNAMDMLHQSKYNILSSWIAALPQELVQERPWLCMYQSWTWHWAGMREEGEDYLLIAERILTDPALIESPDEGPAGIRVNDEDVQLLPGYIATVRAHYAATDENVPRAIEQAQKALQLLPEDDYYTRGTAAVALGAAYWGMGDVKNAEKAFYSSAANALRGGYQYRASSALVYYGMQLVKQALLLEAEKTFREALALSTGPGGRRFPNAGFPLAKLAELACEWNKLDEARKYVDESVEMCEQLGHVDLLAEAYAALARVQLVQGEFEAVTQTLREGDQLLRESKLDPWIRCWLDASRVRLWLSTDRLDDAVRWAEMSGLNLNDTFSYHHDLEHINLARIFVAKGVRQPSGPYLADALDLLDRLLDASESAGWTHQGIEILVLKAIALHNSGDGRLALAALGRALKLAEPGGYVRTFIDEKVQIAHMLRELAHQGENVDYVNRLLGAVAAQKGDDREIILVDPLSDREMQVLRLLATQLSVPEIADELFITVNTVRSHVKSIYSKLNVNRRMAAIQRAEELGLL